MRPGYSTLTPAVVHRAARHALAATLGFGRFGRAVTPTALLDLLLLVAATARGRPPPPPRPALAAPLGFGRFGRAVPPPALLDLLLLVAAPARTLFAVVPRHFPFSHETGRRAVRAHLPHPDVLRERLADA